MASQALGLSLSLQLSKPRSSSWAASLSPNLLARFRRRNSSVSRQPSLVNMPLAPPQRKGGLRYLYLHATLTFMQHLPSCNTYPHATLTFMQHLPSCNTYLHATLGSLQALSLVHHPPHDGHVPDRVTVDSVAVAAVGLPAQLHGRLALC